MTDNARSRRRRRDMDDLLGDTGDDGYVTTPEDKLSFSSASVYKIKGGVSVQWLAQAFRLTRHVVQKKLGDLRPISSGNYGNPLYDLPEAAALLVEPKVDIKTFLKTAKAEQLPENLRLAVWQAKLKKQQWEEKAGDLWRTGAVIARFSEVLGNIRSRLQQIPDRLERLTGLTIEQYRLIRNIVDETQEEIYAEIMSMREDSLTPNQLIDESLDEDDEV